MLVLSALFVCAAGAGGAGVFGVLESGGFEDPGSESVLATELLRDQLGSEEPMSFMKLMGVGLTVAVLMDATVVRGLLVPAFMRLAGEANWWAPAPLRRLHERWGLHEAEPADR